MLDPLVRDVTAPKRSVAIDLACSGRVDDGTRDFGRNLIALGHIADDGEGESLQPIGVSRFEVVFDGNGLDGM